MEWRLGRGAGGVNPGEGRNDERKVKDQQKYVCVVGKREGRVVRRGIPFVDITLVRFR